jgi:VIT1/CCC1 family predicted Fe2+/Mn2+ transporter
VLRHVISDESSHAGGLPAAMAVEGQATLHQRSESIRNVIYGLNDGLTATLGVLAGVGGATPDPNVVLAGGLAAMTASAVSMAGGAYIATKSQREVFEEQVTRAGSAIEALPQLERRELEQIYRAKGLTDGEARTIVDRITADKSVWLQTQVREELGLDPSHFEDPIREGAVAGIATFVGGAIPVIAYLIGRLVAGHQVVAALAITFFICIACLFLMGSARSFFTGKGGLRSGLEMMLVGAAVAIATYLLGSLFKPA